MGGYLAALYAARHFEIKRLLLLAPAFRFADHWRETVGAQALENWRRTGKLAIYHYSRGTMTNLDYGIVEESLKWEAEPEFQQPAHIFHGAHDTVVPLRFSQEYVARHRHVQLTSVNSDHELTSALDTIWTQAKDALL